MNTAKLKLLMKLTGQAKIQRARIEELSLKLGGLHRRGAWLALADAQKAAGDLKASLQSAERAMSEGCADDRPHNACGTCCSAYLPHVVCAHLLIQTQSKRNARRAIELLYAVPENDDYEPTARRMLGDASFVAEGKVNPYSASQWDGGAAQAQRYLDTGKWAECQAITEQMRAATVDNGRTNRQCVLTYLRVRAAILAPKPPHGRDKADEQLVHMLAQLYACCNPETRSMYYQGFQRAGSEDVFLCCFAECLRRFVGLPPCLGVLVAHYHGHLLLRTRF